MRDYNPVKEGIKKHGTARAYFLSLKQHVSTTGGLTAREWDWYRARQREWEPEVLAADEARGARNYALKKARSLSVGDLKMILEEKTGSATE